MQDHRRKFTRQSAASRKEALIVATLDLMAEQGVQAATVRAIAQRAEVTQGLIRHYFTTKEELIRQAYECHMNALTDQAAAVARAQGDGTALDQLRGFIAASLCPPVVDDRALALWAGFMALLRHDDMMRAIHERSYLYFRHYLQGLISDALAEAARQVSPEQLFQMTVGCNAVVDGLWLEGSALPDGFEEGALPQIGLKAIGAILDLPLAQG